MFNINKNKIYVVPNFVDTNLFKRNLDIEKSKKLVVGRLNKQKNIELIIKAISNTKYVLDIIGNGNRDIYEEMIKNIILKLIF